MRAPPEERLHDWRTRGLPDPAPLPPDLRPTGFHPARREVHRVFALMRLKGLEMRDLERESGVDLRVIVPRLARNPRARLSVASLERLADALGVPVWLLFADEPMWQRLARLSPPERAQVVASWTLDIVGVRRRQ